MISKGKGLLTPFSPYPPASHPLSFYLPPYLSPWEQMYFDEFDMLDRRYLEVFPGRRRSTIFLQLVRPLSVKLSQYHRAQLSRVFDYVQQLYSISEADIAAFPAPAKDNTSPPTASSSAQHTDL